MERERLAIQCLSSVGMALVFYGSIIIGAEIGGLTKGYPGKGREVHEQIIKQLKQMFFGDKNNRPRR
jgi:hypothetical protein